MMRYSSLIIAEEITITTGSLLLEGDATLDVSGLGASSEIGDGVVLPDGAGVGGGHGGYGGGADKTDFGSG